MQSTKTKHVIIEKKDGLLNLTLNRPEQLNAFSPEMITSLIDAIHLAKNDDTIKVVIISGSGRAFSAGGDVKTMGQKLPLEAYDHIGKLNELILEMSHLEKPILAAVHGYAAGAGFNLALACDIILATEDSKFVLSFTKVGLISDGGGLSFLPRLIGPYRAKELFYNAAPLTAEKAHSLGIVNQIYAINEFSEKVKEYALKLAEGATLSYGFIKKIANQSLTSSLEEILEQERITQATLIVTEDHNEGVQAFKEKRDPLFKGR